MPGTEMGPKRRLVSPWVHQYDLRADLLNLYRKDPRFRRIVETDLRPQWQEIEHDFRALWPFPSSHGRNVPPGFERLVGAESFLLASAERMAAALPRTRLERLPEAGHIAPLDNPRGFLEITDRFLTAEG